MLTGRLLVFFWLHCNNSWCQSIFFLVLWKNCSVLVLLILERNKSFILFHVWRPWYIVIIIEGKQSPLNGYEAYNKEIIWPTKISRCRRLYKLWHIGGTRTILLGLSRLLLDYKGKFCLKLANTVLPLETGFNGLSCFRLICFGGIQKNSSFSFNEHEKIEFEKLHNISTLRTIFNLVKLEGKKALAATRLCIAYNKEINCLTKNPTVSLYRLLLDYRRNFVWNLQTRVIH